MKLAIASILAGSAVAFAPQASVSFLSNRTHNYIGVHQEFLLQWKNIENSHHITLSLLIHTNH